MSNDNSASRDSHRAIIKSTSIISAGTLLSRILGFFRDIILAKLLGTGFRADAFFLALKIPNLFRDLAGEGAMNSSVVPVLAEYQSKKNKEEFQQFINVMFTLTLIMLSVITILGILGAPVIVRILAPGFAADPEKLNLSIQLTRLLFPYLILIGLTAYSMAILYTFRSFLWPALSPSLLNVAMIVSALISFRYMKEPIYGLSIGVIVGGILQLAVQMRPLLKRGVPFCISKNLYHPGAIQAGKLFFPRLLGAGVYQLTVFVDTFCASLADIVGPGGISAIYYSNRIIQFPMGIFSVALASAVLPTLSGLAAQKDLDQLKRTVVFSLENIFFVMFPTSIMIMLLSTPLIRVLFERGEFDPYSTAVTSSALFFMGIGLFSFGGIKILVTAFHALQDTKTPVKVAACCLLLNTALNFLLMKPLKVGGIALASSIAATVDFSWLFYALDKKLGGINTGFREFILKVLTATIITGAVVYGLWRYIGIPLESVRLTVVGLLGMGLYGLLCFYFRVEPARNIYQWVKLLGKK